MGHTLPKLLSLAFFFHSCSNSSLKIPNERRRSVNKHRGRRKRWMRRASRATMCDVMRGEEKKKNKWKEREEREKARERE